MISYLYLGFNKMITLEYTYTVYKNLLNPVLGTHQPNQTGFFSYDVIAFISTIKGYAERYLSPGRAATLKKESLTKSTSRKILITRQGNKQPTQRHNPFRWSYLRDQFPFYKDRFNECSILDYWTLLIRH